jgi:hypothetical protein
MKNERDEGKVEPLSKQGTENSNLTSKRNSESGPGLGFITAELTFPGKDCGGPASCIPRFLKARGLGM